MNDYIKQLEQQNEELRQMLAVHQDHMPRWHDFETTVESEVVDCAYVLENRVFGFIKRLDGGELKAKFGGPNATVMTYINVSIDDLKHNIERAYLDTFIAVVKP
jgi:hypothetical protein